MAVTINTNIPIYENEDLYEEYLFFGGSCKKVILVTGIILGAFGGFMLSFQAHPQPLNNDRIDPIIPAAGVFLGGLAGFALAETINRLI